MFLVGLSGGIASGKSTVVAILRELGCAVIDADVIAREVVQPHFKAYRQIVRYFGTEILLENGEINREALGNIIFSHPEKRQLLNSITHPEIQKEMLKQILKHFVLGCRYVILDIPLLFETNRLTKFMKYTVLVYWREKRHVPSSQCTRGFLLRCPPNPALSHGENRCLWAFRWLGQGLGHCPGVMGRGNAENMPQGRPGQCCRGGSADPRAGCLCRTQNEAGSISAPHFTSVIPPCAEEGRQTPPSLPSRQ
ncbi:dephospho-CoA kinase domain-containing protein isoform X1 [Strix uralensis]|uniref:dephospho-CoA kinase domain-containing protein isoform X1 n=1 Tax=Strix uralensis TaxID=36305 RepID=UPI003DA752E6